MIKIDIFSDRNISIAVTKAKFIRIQRVQLYKVYKILNIINILLLRALLVLQLRFFSLTDLSISSLPTYI